MNSKLSAVLSTCLAALCLAAAAAQTAPDASIELVAAEAEFLTCLTPTFVVGAGSAGPVGPPRVPDSELSPAALEQRARRQAYRELLPAYLARLPQDAVRPIMPVEGVRVSQVANTYGAPRSGGRGHQGQDIFAPRWTPIRSATEGIVFEISDRFLGGRGVMILGPAGTRYFYTHLEAYAEGLREGMWVTVDTLIGYVGNDGNAATTPTHLHFAVYEFDPLSCRHRSTDPLPLLVDRQ